MTSGTARQGQPSLHSITSGGYQRNGNITHTRPPPGFENYFPSRQPAPTQFRGQRGGTSTRGTSRPARTNPQPRASAQSRGGHQASHVNTTGRSGHPLTKNASHQISAGQHQQNSNRGHHGVGYYVTSGDSSSGSTEILTSGKPRDSMSFN